MHTSVLGDVAVSIFKEGGCVWMLVPLPSYSVSHCSKWLSWYRNENFRPYSLSILDLQPQMQVLSVFISCLVTFTSGKRFTC